MKRIQIVEDDKSLSSGIEMTLGSSNICFVKSESIKEAKDDFENYKINMIILYINLPDGSGYDYLKWVRNRSDVPVLILTANDLEINEVMGFELGADDYVTKPFSLAVLRARVSAILRRDKSEKKEELAIDSFRFDFENSEFEKSGIKIILSPTEQKLLRILVNNRGQLLTRDLLFDRIWGNDSDFVDENALSVTVKRLRSKIGEGENGVSYIQTVYGQGYVWKKKQR